MKSIYTQYKKYKKKKVFSKKVESWQEAVNAKRKKFYLEWPPCSPKKTKFCYDSVRQPSLDDIFFWQKMTTFQGPTTSKIGLEFFLQ